MRSIIRYKQRPSGEWLAVGLDGKSRLVELVYRYDDEDDSSPRHDAAVRQNPTRTGIGEASMNVSDYMKKHGLTVEALDEMAAPYERGDFDEDEGAVYIGSHVDAVGKKRVTVIYDASAMQRVDALARRRGVKPSQVYRDALDYYLSAQA